MTVPTQTLLCELFRMVTCVECPWASELPKEQLKYKAPVLLSKSCTVVVVAGLKNSLTTPITVVKLLRPKHSTSVFPELAATVIRRPPRVPSRSNVMVSVLATIDPAVVEALLMRRTTSPK